MFFGKKTTHRLIDIESEREAKYYLDKWSTAFYSIERKYRIHKKLVSNRDYTFLQLLGKSVHHISMFNTVLIKNLRVLIGEDEASPFKDVLAYYKFNNNLIASKIKYFFYKETPYVNINAPILSLNWEIFVIAGKILKCFSEGKWERELRGLLCSFFFKLGSLYSFIFCQQRKKGFFARFTDNNLVAKQIVNDIDFDICNLQPTAFKTHVHETMLLPFKVYYKEYVSENVPDREDKLFSDLFTKYQKNKNIRIDAFCNRLVDLLWKFEGLSTCATEFIDNDEKHHVYMTICNKYMVYLRNYLNYAANCDKIQKIDFKKIYSYEIEFIRGVQSFFVYKKPIGEVKEIFCKIQQYAGEDLPKSSRVSISIQDAEETDLKKFIEMAKGEKDENVNIQNMFLGDEFNKCVFFLYLYAKAMRNHLHSGNSEIVAFYQSGVFLGHVVNLFTNSKENIWIFKSSPYISTVPAHTEDSEDVDSLLIVDDSFKTGYTYSVYESYVVRNMFESNLSTFIFPFFDFDYYIKIQDNYSSMSLPLVRFEQGLIPTNIRSLRYLAKHAVIPDQELTFHAYSKDFIQKSIKLMCGKDVHGFLRIDLDYVLTSTKLYVSICNYYADEIEKLYSSNAEKSVCIIAPSKNALILKTMTAFLLQERGITIEKTDNLKSELFLSVAIDLSVVTGNTLVRACNDLLLDSDMERVNNISQALQKFDAVFTVVNFQIEHTGQIVSITNFGD